MPDFSDFDFHSHSNVSDGLLSPAAVVDWAADRGVTFLALTDHDSLAGVRAARQTAVGRGIGFVDGVEISAEWERHSVHIVGLGIDPENAALNTGLSALRGGRIERARRMGEALAALGISGAFEGAMRYAAANPELVSRAHFARYLVEIGLFQDRGRVFDHYLTPGKPGYVEHRWATLAESIGWIRAAGGVAVVAHPGRYKMSGNEMWRFLKTFRDLGGEALEVVCGHHGPERVQRFSRLARRFGFYASRGSDFHGADEHGGGRLAPLPEDVRPVWQRLS